MATRNRRCRICDRPIPSKRAATYPQAIQCGKAECDVENHRRQRNLKVKRWRDKRIAADPEFRLRALRQCRERYVRRRLAAGKTVGPPAPWARRAPDCGSNDTFLAAIRRSASGALLGPGKWVWGLLRRRRERKDYERTMHILTRQRNMPALKKKTPAAE